MPGTKKLRKIQMGRESTAGDAVVATTIWRGLGVPDDLCKTEFAEEDVGYLSGVDRTYMPQLLAGLAMEAVPATFEQIVHILEAGIKTATPTSDGAGTGRIYAYAFPTTAKNTIKTYTLEAGDDQAAEEMEYCYVESFKLSGKAGAALMMSAEWRGRQLSTTSFTTGLSLVVVEEILFSKSTIAIDAVSGSIGATVKSSTLLSADLDVKTGWTHVFTGDGQLYFTFAKSTEPEVTLDITFEHDATSVAEKVIWRAQTPRLIRLKVQGSALSSAGTTYTYKTLIIDLAGKWEKFDKIGEQDGNDIIKAKFRGRYNTTGAQFATITVVNELASVP